MMTVITYVSLREGVAAEWDTAMRARLDAARKRPGWVRGQLLMPLDDITRRAIVGAWDSRSDWEAWHQDPAFEETRQRLANLEAGPSETTWFEIIAEPPSLADQANRLARQLLATAEGAIRQVSERAGKMRRPGKTEPTGLST